MRSNSIRQSERVDELFHQGVLDDGLPVRVIPKPGYQKKFAILATDYGSIDTGFAPVGGEDLDSPEGVAHFLEHKLFEDEAGDAFNQFAQYGASANAWTSYTDTAYHFTASTSFYECLDLLMSFVTNPYFTEEQIEKERKVIEQEIRMYDDNPDSRAHLNLLKALYHVHPVRCDVPGTVDSIARIDKSLLELCHRTFYRPDNMLLVVAGDLDPAEVFARAEANVQRRLERAPTSGGNGNGSGFRRLLPQEPLEARERRIEERMAVSQPLVWIGSKETPVAPGPDLIRSLRETNFMLELVFGRSTAFFEKHRESGVVDDTFSASFHMGRGGYAHLLIGGETPDPDGMVRVVEEGFAEARERGLDADDFTRLRNKAWGRFLRSFNSLESIAIGEADSSLQGWDLLEYLDLLESITLERVTARLEQVFAPERRAVSVVLPLE